MIPSLFQRIAATAKEEALEGAAALLKEAMV
jgi:hypothetical protein